MINGDALLAQLRRKARFGVGPNFSVHPDSDQPTISAVSVAPGVRDRDFLQEVLFAPVIA